MRRIGRQVTIEETAFAVYVHSAPGLDLNIGQDRIHNHHKSFGLIHVEPLIACSTVVVVAVDSSKDSSVIKEK